MQSTAHSKEGPDDEYLTVVEVAAILKVSSKRVRNLMSCGTFCPGQHFFRRRGIGPRFLRSRLEAWLRDGSRVQEETIPMVRGTASRIVRRSDEVV
jgi:Helix-turn-helix domain